MNGSFRERLFCKLSVLYMLHRNSTLNVFCNFVVAASIYKLVYLHSETPHWNSYRTLQTEVKCK